MAIHTGRRARALALAAGLHVPLALSTAFALAQEITTPRRSLIEVGTAADLALDARQAAKLARYRADRAAVAVTVVRVATDRLVGTDQFKLDLGGQPPVALERRSLTERSPRGFSWNAQSAAQLGGNPRDVSDATLVVDGDSVVGTIRFAGKTYRIRPLGGGLSALIEIDQARMPAEHPPAFDRQQLAPDTATQRDGAAAADDCGTYNLMVAYTAQAKAQAGDIDSTIQLAIDETNQGYAASGVTTRVNLVHRYETPYADSGDLGADLDRFTRKGDGHADEMQALRDQYAADVAILLTGRSNYCGVAWLYPGAESAFGVVAEDCATGYFSFAHEIGHIQGARHNPEIDSGTTPFAFGHGYYYQPERWRTIMSYDCPGGCARLNHWSNPTKTRNGVALGTTTVSDNTRALSTSACRVANFRSGGATGGGGSGGGGGGGGPAWQGWNMLLAGITTSPECLATGSSQIDCWAVTSGNRLAWSRWNGTTWAPWADIGGAAADAPSCVQSGGRLSCFAVATSGELQETSLEGGAWSPWIGRGGALRQRPSCLAFGTAGIECFARGADRQVWQISFDGTAWLPPRSLGGTAGARPACYPRGAGIDCYIRDGNYRMRVKRFANGVWGGWANVGGSIQSPLTCVYIGATTRCFGRGRDNRLRTVAYDGVRWGSWASLGGALASEPSCVPLGGAGKIACLASGASGNVLDKRFDGASWSAFVDIGGGIAGRVVPVAVGDGRAELFARGSDGSLKQNSYR